MERDDVEEQSEDCLLDRHGDCPGYVMVASSSNAEVRAPCRCLHHGAERP